MPQALPANPDLEWLKKSARKRLIALRAIDPAAKLHQAQLAIANDYGFKSWRSLKAHLDSIETAGGRRDSVFAAARAGEVEAVSRAFAAAFDPLTPDRDGRTIHQIAKDPRLEAIELLARDIRAARPGVRSMRSRRSRRLPGPRRAVTSQRSQPCSMRILI